MRPEATIPKIEQVFASGLSPAIYVVHVTPELAMQRTLQRFRRRGAGREHSDHGDHPGRGCPTACAQCMSGSVTKSSFDSSTTATRTSHNSTLGGTIWSYSDRRVSVSKLNSVLKPSSSGSKPGQASVTKPTDKPSDKPRFVSEEQWLKAISDGTKRMSQDEAFRLEIARKLS